MDNNSLPILYSFIRCPYAIRARIALFESKINCIIREVDLKNKPQELIDISPKATVPVMCLNDGTLIDESLDIVYYALKQNKELNPTLIDVEIKNEIDKLIHDNDKIFVMHLKKYKYHQNYELGTKEESRKAIEENFLKKYENILENNEFLFGRKTLADIAILPFIRQFALSDQEWFDNSDYTNIKRWLNYFIDSDGFKNIIMKKRKAWNINDQEIQHFL